MAIELNLESALVQTIEKVFQTTRPKCATHVRRESAGTCVGVWSSTCSEMDACSQSLPLELRVALLDEGRSAFLLIFGADSKCEVLRLKLQR